MKNYSKIGLFKSKGRLFKEPVNQYRSPFQRDRDRIIHSTAFRRLKHKTQVLLLKHVKQSLILHHRVPTTFSTKK